MTQRGRNIVLWTGALCLLAVLPLAWWWTMKHREVPLEPAWDARVVVIAGDGTIGTSSGPALNARFEDPFGIAVRPDGTILLSDGIEQPLVRAISPDGRVSTVAGGARGFQDGPAATARFETISGLALGADGTLFVADTGNNAIRRITPDGHVFTVAGDGTPGYFDGPGAQARFNGPVGVAVDPSGGLVIADTYNDRIRRVDVDGTVTTLGDWHLFDTPSGVAVDAAGRIYIADTAAGVIHVLGLDGDLSTLPAPYPHGMVRPVGIATSAGGELYVTDEAGRVVEFGPDGSARVVAGGSPGFRDGTGQEARFRRPSGIAVAGPGRLVIADTGNALVRLVAAVSQLEHRPPPPPGIAPHFDAKSFAMRPLLWPVPPMDGPHEIAGTMGEARGSDAERLHSGVDVRIEDGTPVLAVRAGAVSSPVSTGAFGTLNEWLRVGSLTYVHIRAGRDRAGVPLDQQRFVPAYSDDGTLVSLRAKRGARFGSGDLIGSVNRFNHVHLNVGWPGEEYNPLAFRLLHFTDSIAPTIARGGVTLLDDAGIRLTRRVRGRLVVSGPVQIVVDAWDQADGNRSSRRLAPYSLGYQVLHADGSPLPGFESPVETIRMDQLGRDADASLIYAPGSGIPFYGGRTTRFLFNVTNTFSKGVAAKGRWDAGQLSPGNYTVRVFAADREGNVSSRDLPVLAEMPGAEERQPPPGL